MSFDVFVSFIDVRYCCSISCFDKNFGGGLKMRKWIAKYWDGYESYTDREHPIEAKTKEEAIEIAEERHGIGDRCVAIEKFVEIKAIEYWDKSPELDVLQDKLNWLQKIANATRYDFMMEGHHALPMMDDIRNAIREVELAQDAYEKSLKNSN